jgi:uncharacterized protein (TIGR03790 family)
MQRLTWMCMWTIALTGCSPTSADEGALEAGSSSTESSTSTTDEETTEDSSTDTGETTTTQTETDSTETDTGFPDEPPTVLFPRSRIDDAELAVLVNDNDPQSVAVADYYMSARGLPAQNLIHLAFPVAANLTQADFELAYADMQAELPEGIQALALSWTQPYLVDCMSVTTAFSAGFDFGFCGGCAVTNTSPYYDSPSFYPFDDHGIRPTMMLAGSSAEDVFALIDRGLLADGSVHPVGDGYLIRTTDVARSVRYLDFQAIPNAWDHDGGLTMTYIDNSAGMGSDALTDTQNVMFYFTGLASVPGIETNTYLPGAIADHLTSFGGQVPTSGQMSAVAWLEAGATASFGTVVEPCNHLQKFPRASVAIDHYFRGETLIEAYSKSVEWPGQGLFVGDPLARPWDGSSVDHDPGTGLLQITTNVMQPGINYRIESAPTADGPWTTLVEGSVAYSLTFTFDIPEATEPFYRLFPVP